MVASTVKEVSSESAIVLPESKEAAKSMVMGWVRRPTSYAWRISSAVNAREDTCNSSIVPSNNWSSEAPRLPILSSPLLVLAVSV